MAQIKYFLILLVVTQSTFALGQSDTTTRAHYLQTVDYCLNQLRKGSKPLRDSVLYVIPANNSETEIFCRKDYIDDSTSDLFYKLNNLIINYCEKGDRDILTQYILYSKQVDGYFAEDYFESLVPIQKAQQNLFCQIVHHLPKSETELILVSEEYNCK